jgi:hypothetical protein
MQIGQQWADENRPSKDLDYLRLVAVTSVIESENLANGPKAALGQRFDYDTTLRYAMRRIEETSQETKLENPPAAKLLGLLIQSWAEGFIFGSLIYRQEHRGLRPEPFLDRIALANARNTLASLDGEGLSRLYNEAISKDALGYVSSVRSMKALQILDTMAPVADHRAIKSLLGSHWMDGLLLGLIFEEMGGHVEGPKA